MEQTKEAFNTALYFSQDNGFDSIIYRGKYNDNLVYLAVSAALHGTISGYPHFILINKELKCRFSTPEEALEII